MTRNIFRKTSNMHVKNWKYTPGQKYKTTLKNEEKDIYKFLFMKIRYMKVKVKRHLNLE